jgi:DNA-binding FrmR family transcriptional regulator
MERATQRGGELKQNLQTRLKKAEGQVRAILRMIENDAYCDDVITQLTAASAALNSIAKLVLEHHVQGCFVKIIRDGDQNAGNELLLTINKMMNR